MRRPTFRPSLALRLAAAAVAAVLAAAISLATIAAGGVLYRMLLAAGWSKTLAVGSASFAVCMAALTFWRFMEGSSDG